jgi:hypothetical protein
MEPSGRNPWQPVANGTAARTAQTGENRCRGSRPGCVRGSMVRRGSAVRVRQRASPDPRNQAILAIGEHLLLSRKASLETFWKCDRRTVNLARATVSPASDVVQFPAVGPPRPNDSGLLREKGIGSRLWCRSPRLDRRSQARRLGRRARGFRREHSRCRRLNWLPCSARGRRLRRRHEARKVANVWRRS